ncbi:hypothetical protein [Aquimarina algiphila]|uniref:hypothetical protein n=1 Tax=Aquimarina algiphila TaxID=2047982 RepID=UPI00232FE0B8|nr:hypothetical protein [Aquimarina algiphila]
MSIQITTIERLESYKVNGKHVYKNSNGQWITSEELTCNELRFFYKHIEGIEMGLVPGRIAKGIYTP